MHFFVHKFKAEEYYLYKLGNVLFLNKTTCLQLSYFVEQDNAARILHQRLITNF